MEYEYSTSTSAQYSTVRGTRTGKEGIDQHGTIAAVPYDAMREGCPARVRTVQSVRVSSEYSTRSSVQFSTLMQQQRFGPGVLVQSTMLYSYFTRTRTSTALHCTQYGGKDVLVQVLHS